MKNRSKRLPMRTCVACRQVKPKRELTRLVCTGQGRVDVDAGGKKEGRGAYLCRDPKCWESGLKGNRLEHCLKTTISPENHGELERYFKEAIS